MPYKINDYLKKKILFYGFWSLFVSLFHFTRLVSPQCFAGHLPHRSLSPWVTSVSAAAVSPFLSHSLPPHTISFLPFSFSHPLFQDYFACRLGFFSFLAFLRFLFNSLCACRPLREHSVNVHNTRLISIFSRRFTCGNLSRLALASCPSLPPQLYFSSIGLIAQISQQFLASLTITRFNVIMRFFNPLLSSPSIFALSLFHFLDICFTIYAFHAICVVFGKSKVYLIVAGVSLQADWSDRWIWERKQGFGTDIAGIETFLI